MRWLAVILLVTLTLTAAVPPLIVLSCDPDSGPALVTLDICHNAAPALSSNGEMPFMHESSLTQIPATAFQLADSNTTLFPEFILVNNNERPPRS